MLCNPNYLCLPHNDLYKSCNQFLMIHYQNQNFFIGKIWMEHITPLKAFGSRAPVDAKKGGEPWPLNTQ